MKQVGIGLLMLVVVMIMPTTTLAAYTQASNGTTDVTQTVNDDAFIAGSSVSISAPIQGELFGAGQTITVNKSVERSLFIAGNTVAIKQGAAYNAFVGGNTVTLSGIYGHDVFAAGNTVVVESGTVIHGSLYAAGQSVEIHGTIDGSVRVGASTVTSDAVINGSLTGYVQELSFTGGSIAGDLSYRSDQDAKGLNQVNISGQTNRSTPSTAEASTTNNGGGFDALGVFFRFLSIMLIGALLILLLPKKIQVVADDVKSSWANMFGLGLLVLVGGPILAGIAFGTLIGWPIALIILTVWFILLFLSAILGTITLGSLVMRMKTPNWWTALAVGALVIVILTSLPVVGSFIRIIIFIALTLPTFGASLQWWKNKLA